MKKTFGMRAALCFALCLLSASAFAAKAKSSKVANMLKKGDPVSNIKKLSEMLKSNPQDQEAADVFMTLYQREMNKGVEGLAAPSNEVTANFAKSKGAGSTWEALKVVKSKIPAGTQVWDEPSVAAVRKALEKLERIALDFYHVQSYAGEMPAVIGSSPAYNIDETEVPFLGKQSRAFLAKFVDARRTEIWNSEGNFDFMCAEVMVPVTTMADKITLFKHFITAYSHPSKYKNKDTAYARMVEYGNAAGDAKMAEALALAKQKQYVFAVSASYDARSIFVELDKFDPKKGGTARMPESHYVSGLCYYEKSLAEIAAADFDNGKKDMQSAITNFSLAGKFKDAADRKAICEAAYRKM